MVFWNRGTPKSSILTGFFSLINHPFWVPFNWHFPALLPIRGEHDKISHGGLGHPRTSSFDVSRSATELAAEKIPIGWCIDGNAPKPEGHGVFITYRKTERVVLNILDSVTPGKKKHINQAWLWNCSSRTGCSFRLQYLEAHRVMCAFPPNGSEESQDDKCFFGEVIHHSCLVVWGSS